MSRARARLAALTVAASVALTAVSCGAKDYSSAPHACPSGYQLAKVSHHAPDSWACYKVIQ